MSSNYATPKFSKSKEIQTFFTTLNTKVYQYFKQKNIKRTGNLELYFKTVIMLGIYLGPYFLLVTMPMSGWIQILLCLMIGIGMAGVGMNVMHDGNHGSYSSNQFVNKLMGSTMYLLAGNSRNWKVQHNILHHTYTNIHEHDEDLEAGRIIRFSKHSKWQSIHKYQHFYSLFLYGFLTLNWLLLTDFRQSADYFKRGLLSREKHYKTLHWIKLVTFKILYFSMWIVIPILFMENPWWQILIGFVVIHYTAGFILSVIFQLAHVVEDTDIIKYDKGTELKNSWATHQLFTTTNFSTKSFFLNWYTGGLNHQIEHHLFPGISHVHYKKISNIVKQVASEFGLPYYEYQTIGLAINSHMRHLKSLSRK